MDPRIEYVVVFAVIIIPGCFLFFGRDWSGALIRMGIALFLVPASYIPNLVVAESWASYRTQVALTGLVLILAMTAIMGWMKFLRACRWVPALCAVAVAGGAMAASRNVTTEFAVPAWMEYHLIERALLKTKFGQGDQICFNLAQWRESFAPISRYDEFGTVSSAEPWVPARMSWLILTRHHSAKANLFLETNKILTGNIVPPQNKTVFPACKEIDLYGILNRDPGNG